ncbi:hypothetical protein C0991_003916 [Blastosporella zonata]|nr:hypothetical protein C0991_003916 [Blastosporella zonata]
MVTALCEHYSPPLLSFPGEDASYHPFPPPSALTEPNVSTTLRSLGFGYRADFIQRTAKMLVDMHGKASFPHDKREVSEKWLMSLRDGTTNDAREELLKFVGVGRKVADCVLLMSLDKKEVVPVDTHVHQIAVKYYGLKGSHGSNGKKANMTPKLYDDVNTRLTNVWGEYAGWAHSVLFTADLKSFASHGLPTTTSSASASSAQLQHTIVLPTPPMTPSLSSKRGLDKISDVPAGLILDTDNDYTLVERVKRRRRV